MVRSKSAEGDRCFRQSRSSLTPFGAAQASTAVAVGQQSVTEQLVVHQAGLVPKALVPPEHFKLHWKKSNPTASVVPWCSLELVPVVARETILWPAGPSRRRYLALQGLRVIGAVEQLDGA